MFKKLLISLLMLIGVSPLYADSIGGGSIGGSSLPIFWRTATSDLVRPRIIQVPLFDDFISTDGSITLTNFAAGMTHSALTGLSYASASHTGFEPTVTKGNLTETTSNVLTITGGTEAVIGSGATFRVATADTTTSGILTSTNWNTFNNKTDYSFGANNFSGTGNFVTTGTATSDVVDTQYLEYSTGGNLTIRDGLTINGSSLIVDGNTVNLSDTTDEYVLAFDVTTQAWRGVVGGGAPTDADYLVGTANGGLSAEIVVGTTPGGSLGGTWASPTIDDLFLLNTGDTSTGALTINNNDGVDNENMLTIGDADDLDNLIVYGNVGIGTTGPVTTFHVAAANRVTDSVGNAFIESTSAYGIDLGGQLDFAGQTNTGVSGIFGSVAGRKEAAGTGAAGYLQFATTQASGAVNAERMRITSTGNVGIGTTGPTVACDIIGSIKASNTATGLVVDSQYLEYSTGGNLTIRDGLTINGSSLIVDSNTVNLSDTTDEYVLAFDVTTQAWRGVVNSGGGANTALSNLASVAVNVSIVSDTDSTDDLGSASVSWANVYSDNFRQGTATDLTIENDGQDNDIVLKVNDGGVDTTAMTIDGAVGGVVTIPLNSGARAYCNTAQVNLTSDAYTKVVLDAETYDIQAEFDSTTNYRFTAKVAGYYKVSGQVSWQNTVNNKRYAALIYKNNLSVARGLFMTSTADYPSCSINDIIYLAINDYVELFAWNLDAAGTADLLNASTDTFLSVAKIR